MVIRFQLTALRPVGSTQPLEDDVLVGGRTQTPLPIAVAPVAGFKLVLY